MKHFFLLAALIAFIEQTQAQNLHVVYEMEFKMEDLIPNMPPDKLVIFNNILIVYDYIYSNGHSKFNFLESKKRNPELGGKANPQKTVIYKDHNKNVIFKENKDFPDVVSIEDFNSEREWVVDHKKKQNILGYACIKASLKEDESVTVWYCPDIPVMDGPMSYEGVPGFILKAELKGSAIFATKIEFPENISAIKLPEPERFVSPEEFNKIISVK